MVSSQEIIEYLKKNKLYLQEKFSCSEIALFGSFARNEQTENSDIDILVVFKKDTPDLYSVEIELKEHLKLQFGREIDICTRKWIKPVFKPLVLQEAIYA